MVRTKKLKSNNSKKKIDHLKVSTRKEFAIKLGVILSIISVFGVFLYFEEFEFSNVGQAYTTAYGSDLGVCRLSSSTGNTLMNYDSDLVGCYYFDRLPSDNSGNNYNGIHTGVVSNSLEYSGSSSVLSDVGLAYEGQLFLSLSEGSHINVPHNLFENSNNVGTADQGVTVCAWINPSSGNSPLWEFENGKYYTHILEDGTVKSAVESISGEVSKVTSKPLDLGKWNYLCQNYDSIKKQVRLYKNGVMWAEGNILNGYPELNLMNSFMVGSTDSGLGKFEGFIDDVKIWDRSLNDDEIYDAFVGYLGGDFDRDGVLNNLDCNDHNPSYHSEVYCYVDKDRDGYGGMNLEPELFCIQDCTELSTTLQYPEDYSSNNLDCDDNDANIFENCNLDDGSVRCNSNDFSACLSELECSAAGGHWSSSNNCLDPNLDFDGDGVLNIDDCDDINTQKSTMVACYIDNDDDGYGGSHQSELCLDSCDLVNLYVDNNLDCDDNDAGVGLCVVQNEAPTILTESGNFIAYVGKEYRLHIEVFDPEGDDLELNIINSPPYVLS